MWATPGRTGHGVRTSGPTLANWSLMSPRILACFLFSSTSCDLYQILGRGRPSAGEAASGVPEQRASFGEGGEELGLSHGAIPERAGQQPHMQSLSLGPFERFHFDDRFLDGTQAL